MKIQYILKCCLGLSMCFMITIGCTKGSIAATNDKISGTPYKYADVDDDAWYANAVNDLTRREALGGSGINGRDDNGEALFGPNEALTRKLLLVQITGIFCPGGYQWNTPEDWTYGAFYSDVTEDDWFYPESSWAYRKGIMAGFEDGTFRADEGVTREQFAVVVSRAIAYEGLELNPTAEGTASFKDADQVSSWATDAVEEMRALGIFKGDENRNVNPQKVMTRAEFAVAWYTYEHLRYAAEDAQTEAE